jgi:hypothetical protein
MLRKDYNYLVNSLNDNIYGQKFSITYVTNSGFNAASSKASYKKLTKVIMTIRKVSYLDIVNTSTGAIEKGVEFKPKRAPLYISEKLNSLFCRSIKYPDKKYMTLRCNMLDDKSNNIKSVYLDTNCNIVGKHIEEPAIKVLYTNSGYKSRTVGYGRTKVMRENDIKVIHNTPKIENIVRIKIGGIDPLIDPQLKQYVGLI